MKWHLEKLLGERCGVEPRPRREGVLPPGVEGVGVAPGDVRFSHRVRHGLETMNPALVSLWG